MGLLNLIGSLQLNASQFHSELGRAKAAAGSAAGDMASAFKSNLAGALTIGGLSIALKQAIEFGSHINDLSNRLDVSTDSLQSLGFAARQSGSSLDDMANNLKHLAKAREAALADPTGKEAAAFRRLSISAASLRDSKLEQIFSEIAENAERFGFDQKQIADFLIVFGKNGDQAMQVMRDGLLQNVKLFDELGLSINQEGIRTLDRYGDKWDETFEKIKSGFRQAVVGIAEFHEEGASTFDNLIGYTKVFRDFLLQRISGKEMSDQIDIIKENKRNQEAGGGGMVFDRNKAEGGFRDVGNLQDALNQVDFKELKPDEHLKRMIALQERLNSLKFDGLTDDKKREQLLKSIEEIQNRILILRGAGLIGLGSPEALLQQQVNLQEARNKLAGIKPTLAKELSPTRDSLSSVGNFLGSSRNSEAMRELGKIERQLEEIRRNTGRDQSIGAFPL